MVQVSVESWKPSEDCLPQSAIQCPRCQSSNPVKVTKNSYNILGNSASLIYKIQTGDLGKNTSISDFLRG